MEVRDGPRQENRSAAIPAACRRCGVTRSKKNCMGGMTGLPLNRSLQHHAVDSDNLAVSSETPATYEASNFFRRTRKAHPSSPVPNNSSEAGSGVVIVPDSDVLNGVAVLAMTNC